MMRYLLDTSALLAHHRQEAGWEKVHQIFEDDTAVLLVASVTIAEFSRRLLDLGASASEVASTFQNYRLTFSEIVAIDEKVAWAAFEVGRACSTRLPLVDSLIAAAAKTRDAVLVHRDKHMSGLAAKAVKTLDLAR